MTRFNRNSSLSKKNLHAPNKTVPGSIELKVNCTSKKEQKKTPRICYNFGWDVLD